MTGWTRTGADWLLELGPAYAHWNAPPWPSLFLGWRGVWVFWCEWGRDDGWYVSLYLSADSPDGDGD